MDVSLGLSAPHLPSLLFTRRQTRTCSSPTIIFSKHVVLHENTVCRPCIAGDRPSSCQPLCCPAAQASILHVVNRADTVLVDVLAELYKVLCRRGKGESRTSASPPSTTVPRASRREEIPCDNVRGAGVSDSQQRQMPRHLVFARSRSLEGRGPPRAATIC